MFEKAVASFGKNPNINKEKGIVMLPPEIPEIDPIPESKAIMRIPIMSPAF
jgi:hypothetical protein